VPNLIVAALIINKNKTKLAGVEEDLAGNLVAQEK
jgi:hypothetical protein